MSFRFKKTTLAVLVLAAAAFCFLFGSCVGSASSASAEPSVQASTSPESEPSASPGVQEKATERPGTSPGLSSSPSASPAAGAKVAYLTFDDGPSKLTPELLDTLEKCNVHATFFVVGLNAQKYPDTLRRMVGDGDVIGVHSWTHNYAYIYKNTANFLADFNKLKDYITTTTGITPDICRFPGGTNNTVCFQYNKAHIMKTIVSLVRNMGFQYYDWNVSSGEAASAPPSKDEIISSVVSQCKGKKIAVILFHDTDNQDYVDSIPEIVSQLSALGFTFDTLSPTDPSPVKAASVQFKPS